MATTILTLAFDALLAGSVILSAAYLIFEQVEQRRPTPSRPPRPDATRRRTGVPFRPRRITQAKG